MNTDDSPLLRWMKQHNIPLTRERYLVLDFMGDPPEELGAEYKAMMPSLPSEADIIVGHALGVEVTDALDGQSCAASLEEQRTLRTILRAVDKKEGL